LLGVIEFGGATGFLPENIVYVLNVCSNDWLTYWRSATISQSKAALQRQIRAALSKKEIRAPGL